MAETRYIKPSWFTQHVFNPGIAWLTRRGGSMAGSRELSVVGRSSGKVRKTVVNLLEVDGVRYLVAPRGTTQWVRNLRVAGTGQLRVGRRIEDFRSTEVPDEDKVPILRAYLKRWRWEVGQFFKDLSKDPSDAELAALAPTFPAFAITPT